MDLIITTIITPQTIITIMAIMTVVIGWDWKFQFEMKNFYLNCNLEQIVNFFFQAFISPGHYGNHDHGHYGDSNHGHYGDHGHDHYGDHGHNHYGENPHKAAKRHKKAAKKHAKAHKKWRKQQKAHRKKHKYGKNKYGHVSFSKHVKPPKDGSSATKMLLIMYLK